MNTQPSTITKRPDGIAVSYSGPVAMTVWNAKVLASALRLYARAKIVPNRHITPTMLLQGASQYTGKQYKRGEHAKAAEELTFWLADFVVQKVASGELTIEGDGA